MPASEVLTRPRSRPASAGACYSGTTATLQLRNGIASIGTIVLGSPASTLIPKWKVPRRCRTASRRRRAFGGSAPRPADAGGAHPPEGLDLRTPCRGHSDPRRCESRRFGSGSKVRSVSGYGSGEGVGFRRPEQVGCVAESVLEDRQSLVEAANVVEQLALNDSVDISAGMFRRRSASPVSGRAKDDMARRINVELVVDYVGAALEGTRRRVSLRATRVAARASSGSARSSRRRRHPRPCAAECPCSERQRVPRLPG